MKKGGNKFIVKNGLGWKRCRTEKPKSMAESVRRALKFGAVFACVACLALLAVKDTPGVVQASQGAVLRQGEAIKRPALIQEVILDMAVAYGVDGETALRIGECESHFNRYAKNPNGTAKGIYQFTDPTWKFIKAPGHQYDFRENIKQFMIWYPIHPEWWKCK